MDNKYNKKKKDNKFKSKENKYKGKKKENKPKQEWQAQPSKEELENKEKNHFKNKNCILFGYDGSSYNGLQIQK